MPSRVHARFLHEVAARQFPHCFAPRHASRTPLKIDIHLDLIAAGWPEEDARTLLKKYTGSHRLYRQNLIFGAPRIDLNGAVCGEVTSGAVEKAGAQLVDQGLLKEALVLARSLIAA